ncbi:hypothetical protein [Streptomyces anandii]|uniref:hypothetical protein n=1 Tax=Streptomyces anandii TaxID=285454 RepID=UPI00378B8B3B
MPETTHHTPHGPQRLPLARPYFLGLLHPLAASISTGRAVLTRHADVTDSSDPEAIGEAVAQVRLILMQLCDSLRLEELPVTPLETAARRQLERYAGSSSPQAFGALTTCLRMLVVDDGGAVLYDPEVDAPEFIPELPIALDLAQQLLAQSPDVRVTDYTGLVQHARMLDHQLRVLVAAVAA